MANGDEMEGSTVYRYCLTLWPPLSSGVIYSYSGQGRMDRPKGGSPFCHALLGRLRRDRIRGMLYSFEETPGGVSPEKSEGPDTKLTFLGFELDTMALEVRLPRHKLAELSELAMAREEVMLHERFGIPRRQASPRFAGGTVRQGVYEENVRAKGRSQSMVRLNCGFKSDMWWAKFLETWNGVSMIEPGSGQATVEIWTDASGGWGCGAWHPANKEWIQLGWSQLTSPVEQRMGQEGITLQELLPIVLAFAVWGRQWAGQRVMVHCDNTGARSSSMPILYPGPFPSAATGHAHPRGRESHCGCHFLQ